MKKEKKEDMYIVRVGKMLISQELKIQLRISKLR